MWQVQIIGDNDDPTFFLCGRCDIFDASGKFLVTLFPFCVAGAPGLREVLCDPTFFLRGRCYMFDASEKFS